MCVDSVMNAGLVGVVFFFQAEDGIRDLVRSRGLGDVYKRQSPYCATAAPRPRPAWPSPAAGRAPSGARCRVPLLSLIHI